MNNTNKYSVAVGQGFRYFKIKSPNSDEWHFGKVFERPIPKNAEAVSFETWVEAICGEDFVRKEKKRIKNVNEMKRSEIIFETSRDISRLPNPNDEEEFKKIINKSKEFSI